MRCETRGFRGYGSVRSHVQRIHLIRLYLSFICKNLPFSSGTVDDVMCPSYSFLFVHPWFFIDPLFAHLFGLMFTGPFDPGSLDFCFVVVFAFFSRSWEGVNLTGIVH